MNQVRVWLANTGFGQRTNCDIKIMVLVFVCGLEGVLKTFQNMSAMTHFLNKLHKGTLLTKMTHFNSQLRAFV